MQELAVKPQMSYRCCRAAHETLPRLLGKHVARLGPVIRQSTVELQINANCQLPCFVCRIPYSVLYSPCSAFIIPYSVLVLLLAAFLARRPLSCSHVCWERGGGRSSAPGVCRVPCLQVIKASESPRKICICHTAHATCHEHVRNGNCPP